jgi:hypothetical protein
VSTEGEGAVATAEVAICPSCGLRIFSNQYDGRCGGCSDLANPYPSVAQYRVWAKGHRDAEARLLDAARRYDSDPLICRWARDARRDADWHRERADENEARVRAATEGADGK